MSVQSILAIFSKRKRRRTRRKPDDVRAETIERINARGYELVDVSGFYNGKVAARRYLLTDPNGNTIDNGGEGFTSSAEALQSIIKQPRIK